MYPEETLVKHELLFIHIWVLNFATNSAAFLVPRFGLVMKSDFFLNIP
jgi:hypothetical protein